jgi:hypothetical protein
MHERAGIDRVCASGPPESLTACREAPDTSAMQDRYAGDVGDFIKLGLLRHLAAPVSAGGAGLKVGLNWYLAPDESHNSDGKHTSYLESTNRWHQRLKACDPDLLARLAAVVPNGRSVRALEASGALPHGALTHNEMIDPMEGPSGRSAWHRHALDALSGAECVFADPDNGIRFSSNGAMAHKYASAQELADYAQRGQSLVVYQHANRTGDARTQAEDRLTALSSAVHQLPLQAVIARRGSCRFFLITVPDEDQFTRLALALEAFADRWTPHVELA